MSADEINQWKQLAEEYKASWLEAKVELEEYQTSSRDLEAELETQVEHAEGRSRELAQEREHLLTDLNALRDKYEQERVDANCCITSLQKELTEVRNYRDTLERYVRELEQTNDDLERAKRETVASLQDFECRMNQCIERNAFLESELDEKNMLIQTVQRLKDEARDLRQEVDVRAKRLEGEAHFHFVQQPFLATTASLTSLSLSGLSTLPRIPGSTSKGFMGSYTDTSSAVSPSAATTPTPPTPMSPTPTSPIPTSPTPASPTPSPTGGSLAMSSSSRVSALSIVGDLLSKVGALEHKLSQCRNFVKDHHYLHQQEAYHANKALSGTYSIRPPQPVAVAVCSDALPPSDLSHASSAANGWRAWFTGKNA